MEICETHFNEHLEDQNVLAESLTEEDRNFIRKQLDDLLTLNECLPKIVELQRELKNRLQKVKGRAIAKQFIKIKFSDFSITTKECQSATISLSSYQELFQQSFVQHNKSVRLIGVGVRFR